MSRRRLDNELVRRGLVETRSEARRLIDADLVTVGGAIAAKAGRMVDPSEAVELLEVPRFVSRAGAKLDGALDVFDVDVTGVVALDVGASTGGFTDCLLQRGAALVVAVDVGRHQLHERLVAHDSVVSLEQTDIRDLRPDVVRTLAAGREPTVAVADVSFISLRQVLPSVANLVASDATIVTLVKPQFEAGRVEAARGEGIIRDPEVWSRVLHHVVDACGALEMGIMGVVTSSVRGTKGNVEFLLHMVRGASADPAQVDAAIDAAVQSASDQRAESA